MYRFHFENIKNTNQYEELIKVFLQPSEYSICKGEGEGSACSDFAYELREDDKNALKRELYRDLSAITAKRPKWGILTGIRPVKLAGEILERAWGDFDRAVATLREEYLLDEAKIDLITEILRYQREKTGRPRTNSISLYIGIPFCPTRCLYCSFTSNQSGEDEIRRYLEALHKEIAYCGSKSRQMGYEIESVYFGGGTPTTLSPRQLSELLDATERAFDLRNIREYTVEAGRPDTITEEKLSVLKDYGVDRISINPQTMKESTLGLIGRDHTIDDVYKAFEAAHKVGIETINTDLIAGLLEESPEDFSDSLKKIISLGASNVTLHTLAVKRASKLKELDENFNYRDELIREEMLINAHETLRDCGFRPYYLYRQKHTSGNTENTGFCRDDKLSVYNIRIMEEAQSILALGAGGISKIYFPAENRLERVANVSNYSIYIDRIDEMLQRKEQGFFIKSV